MSNQNIFKLFTDDPVKYNSWSLKSNLLMVIIHNIKEKNLSQTEIANNLKLTQPRVSNLINGRLDKFSIDALFEIVFRLGFAGDVTFTPDNPTCQLEMRLKKAVL